MTEPYTTAQELALKSADAVIVSLKADLQKYMQAFTYTNEQNTKLQDELDKLRAELAAEREKTADYGKQIDRLANEIDWVEDEVVAQEKALEEVEAERDAIRSQLNDAGKALQDFVSYGCPACGGDCSAANPPVSLCPMQSARAVLEMIKGGTNE